MPDNDTEYCDADINELVSHVMALRKDFIQSLLADVGVPSAERQRLKGALREVILDHLEDGVLTVERLVAFLDEHEPGGKQHVFLLRPVAAYNRTWRDPSAVRRQLGRRRVLRDLLDGELPLVMPEELTLSSIRVSDAGIEIVGVEARRYFERDDSYDDATTSDEGLPVELRAYVERVARSTVVLRWDVAHRHAALHITQATSPGVSRAHYGDVLSRFGQAVSPWLKLDRFRPVNLHKVMHKLQSKERSRRPWTRSRRGSWETVDGSEVEAISAGVDAGIFDDLRVAAAVDQVADPNSGSTGNLYWLDRPVNPLTEDLHLTILANDSRVHFMRPSSPHIVAHVLEQLRSLL